MKRNLLHGLHILLWLGGKLSVVTQAISDSEWETGMVSRQGDGKGATNYRRTATQDDRKGATNYRRTATPTPTNVTVTVSEGTTSINDTLFDSITSSSGSLCDDKPIQTDRPDQLAAPWIAKKERRVLFVELHTWDLYYGPSKYKTGEYYVSATWDYALRKNGFRVERVSTRHYYEKMTNGEMLAYHRIFVRDPRWHRLYHQKEIMCKVRPMYYYGDWFYRKNDHNYRFQVPFAEKQILSAHIDARNTFMGYFPHNLLDNNESPSKERKKVGLLYGKKPEYFKGHEAVITSLIDSGFELHSTCNDPDCPLPEGVIRHGAMKPATYAGLMKQFSFMLGFQQPEGSPSPLVGMSYGVTFLNPLREGSKLWTQHRAMSRIGFPYTYIVDLHNITSVVEAADWSFRHRFSSYVPPSYRVKSLLHRMRVLLEDESSCISPNISFD